MTDTGDSPDPITRSWLGEVGLNGFAPYLMNRIMGRYNADLRREMAALGLSTAKMRALAVLSVVDGIQMSQLGVYAVVEQSTLSRAVDSLCSDGLARRESDPDDQRATRIFLTRAGRAAFDRMWPHMADSHDRMFQGIPEDERRAFIGTLHKMLNNVRQHEY
ncbi:MarR family winged helix-turn-helix transcriptional regulator [Pseudodonghicola flavimaris]|uniref:MarR family winged helix-turn-helix transcriptional regulator n=1 Tax=Pseudodonghicola flavimaris TaxID=3050036 RepID=A0ABT7F861_9RHOB|nr:MarR family winged helix-turn-helix transcriptional regulator [Pseudodonghicola flavimaris]MDK3020675.1 MarR family winged helix-turn-helix transcriptional regulator [Pseudodonghicola flavimaris]